MRLHRKYSLIFLIFTKSGKASKEVLESIEGNVLKGGGVYEKNGITNETTHAILVAKQVGETKTFLKNCLKVI